MAIAGQGKTKISGYASAPIAVARGVVAALYRRRLSVAAIAEEYREIRRPGYQGAWRNESAPYLVEVMNDITDRTVECSVVMGPAQFGKTEAMLSAIAAAATDDPADTMIVQPTRDMARDFSLRRVDRMLSTSPKLAARLMPGRSDDAVWQKVFRSGAYLNLVWPTTAQLASRDVPRVLIDERDSMTDDVGGTVGSPGEGDPVELARQRTKTFGDLGHVMVASQIKRADGSGIVAAWEGGDRRLWWCPCPECRGWFAPGFDLDRAPLNRSLDQCRADPARFAPWFAGVDLDGLDGIAGIVWSRGLDADAARDAAALLCPHCGALIDERDKRAMNSAGRWIAAAEEVDLATGEIVGERSTARVRSRWFTVMNNFEAWGKIAAAYVRAAGRFDETGDDAALRTVINADCGMVYLDPDAGRTVEAEEIEDRRGTYAKRTVPIGVRCLTASVDVQADRFEVMVTGWREGARAAIVDRFAIRERVVDGVRYPIDPAGSPGDWSVLIGDVMLRRYPREDGLAEMAVMTTAIDTGGLDGVSSNARAFWYVARAAGIAALGITLVKGGKDFDGPRLRGPVWLEKRPGGDANKDGPALFLPNVHEWKGVIARRLMRAGDAPGSIAFPADLELRYLDELTNERKERGRWVKTGPNETLDLLIYAEAALVRIVGEETTLDRVPDWAGFTGAVGETRVAEAPRRRVRHMVAA